ncbi:DUF2945 domain-containing protein [Glaciecola sp. MH2013]|uniref:DUF2945 domain-containing protein n=1 Tax=Glaciecola sp. MH2013 TaxID=2785524 RepID=UPI00189FD13C|nr:DUF2945 domain-containing protein [Glaciecola sp. MH2013]MBF7073435.1 DUF2945 domain-containing protein [Glaciecola sp. MH2013]
MKHFQTNTIVEWDWGNGKGKGYIREKFTENVNRTIKGSEVTRKANDNNPAYLIEQQDGDKVLKSHSEIQKAD